MLTLEDRVLRSSVKARLFNVAESVRISRYTVLGYVGCGGMGVVYSAYDTELDRKVALKLLQADQGLDRGHERLKREAQAMAKLSDPNVVQIYEVGEHDGRVFLAMEFVQGSTLRQWLTAEDRPWREILDKFVCAGRGLAAAHRAGLIHRDFKPDNILVGDDGRVMVTDFGMARTAEGPHAADAAWTEEDEDSADTHSPGSTLSVRLTRTGAVLGTPAYMSPEQHLRQPTDARSDQFSFCVALYEALYDEHPFVGSTRASLAVSVVEGKLRPPPRKSKIPGRIRRALVEGMASNPEGRHVNMDALLHALAGRPVARHSLLLGGAALATLALSIPPLLMADDPCRHAGDTMDQVWSADRRDAVEKGVLSTGRPGAAAAWERVAQHIDDYAADWRASRRSSCEASHVHRTQSDELLDLRTACLDRGKRELDVLLTGLGTGDPSRLLHAVEAIEHLPSVQACDATEDLLIGPAIPRSPTLRQAVSEAQRELADARNLRIAGRYPQAAAKLKVLTNHTKALGHDPSHAEALFGLAELQLAQGRPHRAVQSLDQAVDIAEASRFDRLAARAWTLLAHVRVVEYEDPVRAEEALRRAQANLRRITPDPAQAACQKGVQAEILRRRGDFDRATAILKEGLAALESTKEHELTALTLSTELGHVRLDAGDFAGAKRAYRRAEEIRNRLLGEAHPSRAMAKVDLGLLAQRQGESEPAQRFYREALAIPDAPADAAIKAQTGLFIAAQQAGDLAAARRHIEAALALADEAYPAETVHRASLVANLGSQLYYEGDPEGALRHYDRAIAQRLAAHGEHDIEVAEMQSNRGDALIAMGNFAAAKRSFREALDTLEVHLPADSLVLAYPLKGLAQAELGMNEGPSPKALQLLERALGIHDQHPLATAEAADVQWTLARALESSDPDRAHSLAERALEYHRTLAGRGREQVASIEQWIATHPRPSAAHEGPLNP